MKRQIRRGVFETNSSSTHSLTICLKSDYDKWNNGNVFLFKGSGWCYSDDKVIYLCVVVGKLKQLVDFFGSIGIQNIFFLLQEALANLIHKLSASIKNLKR